MNTTLYGRIQKERESSNYRYFDEPIDPKDAERVASVAAWMGLGPTGLSVDEKHHLARAYANRIKSRVRECLPGWTRRFIQAGGIALAPPTTLAKKIEAYLSMGRSEPLPDDMLFNEANTEGRASMASSLGIGPTCLSSEEKAALANSYHQRFRTGARPTLPGWTKRYPTTVPRVPSRRFQVRGNGAAMVTQITHLNPLVARGMFQASHQHVSPMIRDTLEIGYLDCRNSPISGEHASRLAFPHTLIYDHPPEAAEIDLSVADLLTRSCGNDPEPKWIGVRDIVLFSTHENGYGDRYYTLALYMTSAYSTTRAEWIDPQIERNYL